MIEMVKIDKIDKSEIWQLEFEAEQICTDFLERFSDCFKKKGFVLEITLERFDHISALNNKSLKLNKEQCFDLEYNSCISILIKDFNGKVVEHDEGKLIDNIYIWFVQRYLFFSKRGFINRSSKSEKENELLYFLKEDAELLGVEIF